MLTVEKLKGFAPSQIFATGEADDNRQGLFMANTGRRLRWVAVRGVVHDWAIYCGFAEWGEEEVYRHGDKVLRERHIKMCVPCDEEAFRMYRF
jgi:hypothetical protein